MTYKKYAFLDNREDLFQNLLVKSMSEYAEELANKHGLKKANLAACIRFLVYTYFTPEQISQIKKERIFHKNRKKVRI